ncbi:MAG: septum formation initiator family protein [Chloroflexota bacterium]
MIRGVRPTYRHVFVVLAVVVSLYFAVRTSSAVLVDRALAIQLQNAESTVNTIIQQNAALSAQMAYQQTPAYAEQVAREQLGMMKPGDHVVRVQIAPGPSGPVTAPPPAPVARPPVAVKVAPPNWKRWLALFSTPAQFNSPLSLPAR